MEDALAFSGDRNLTAMAALHPTLGAAIGRLSKRPLIGVRYLKQTGRFQPGPDRIEQTASDISTLEDDAATRRANYEDSPAGMPG
ncbi:hypothetical protein [Oceanibaculum sp.]|uniref:hypothetical protein n=1 Tax=Oceanibaculum sp. TaxID=1903597 RepID=UPI002583CF71|nr:hypothetical protein [Oceanibaculum sp.]MCH2394536.1 hypothetical protein [Oceanibaculum sp.]